MNCSQKAYWCLTLTFDKNLAESYGKSYLDLCPQSGCVMLIFTWGINIPWVTLTFQSWWTRIQNYFVVPYDMSKIWSGQYRTNACTYARTYTEPPKSWPQACLTKIIIADWKGLSEESGIYFCMKYILFSHVSYPI